MELFRDDYAEILQARPGITDLASMSTATKRKCSRVRRNRNIEYITRILPEKIGLSKEYVRRASFAGDLMLIAQTLATVVEGGRPRRPASRS